MHVLVVDGANVVGSRPDGWWHDRAGAARRLQEKLSAANLPYGEVVLVIEGEAKRGNPAGQKGRVSTVHAPGLGDDAVVEEVNRQVGAGDGRAVSVVTAADYCASASRRPAPRRKAQGGCSVRCEY
jgi:hypothetical protein